MRIFGIACCLLLLLVMAGATFAAPVPAGEKDTLEPDWTLDVGGARATYPEVEPNNSCTAPQAVNCGDVVDPAAIDTAGDIDYYSFYVTVGTPITVGTDLATGCTTSIDTYIYLYDPSCVQVASDDDLGPGLYSLISNYSALVTGNYVLAVQHYSTSGTGCYKAIITCTPPASGACCLGGGVCQILTSSACGTAGGTYMGDNSSCSPNPCPQPPANDVCSGAIGIADCTTGTVSGTLAAATNNYDPGSGGCATGYAEAGKDVVYVVSLAVGDVVDLTYTATGYDAAFYMVTDCANVASSCVIGADAGYNVETIHWVCNAANTYYIICDAYGTNSGAEFTLDYAFTCPPPTGACCYADGSCQVLTQSECLAELSGFWLGAGTTCDPNPCTQPLGACCFPDGLCQMLTGEECAAVGGYFMGGTCDPNPCAQPHGVCCFADGSCQVLVASMCSELGGVWNPTLQSCDPNPCPQPLGICCFPDGSCQMTLEADCPTGVWILGGSCDPNPCPQPTGACCFPDGACIVTLQADCNTGDWRPLELCDPNPCPQPPPVGACCFEDGTCQVLTEAECAAAQGTWQSEGSGCDPNPCEPVPVERTTWGQIKSHYR